MFPDPLRRNIIYCSSPPKGDEFGKPRLENCQKKLDFEDNIIRTDPLIFIENDSIEENREHKLFFDSSQNSMNSNDNVDFLRPFSQDFSEKANIKDTVSRKGMKRSPIQYLIDERKTIKKQECSNNFIEEESEILSDTERDDNNLRCEDHAFTRMV
jgi:hypothetical protein